MSVVVQLILKAKDEHYETLRGAMTQILPDTAARDGAELISCAANPEDKSIIIYEIWDKKESQEAYMAWRGERGDLDQMGEMLREPAQVIDMEHVF